MLLLLLLLLLLMQLLWWLLLLAVGNNAWLTVLRVVLERYTVLLRNMRRVVTAVVLWWPRGVW
jgi:hypothetical protein